MKKLQLLSKDGEAFLVSDVSPAWSTFVDKAAEVKTLQPQVPTQHDVAVSSLGR